MRHEQFMLFAALVVLVFLGAGVTVIVAVVETDRMATTPSTTTTSPQPPSTTTPPPSTPSPTSQPLPEANCGAVTPISIESNAYFANESLQFTGISAISLVNDGGIALGMQLVRDFRGVVGLVEPEGVPVVSSQIEPEKIPLSFFGVTVAVTQDATIAAVGSAKPARVFVYARRSLPNPLPYILVQTLEFGANNEEKNRIPIAFNDDATVMAVGVPHLAQVIVYERKDNGPNEEPPFEYNEVQRINQTGCIGDTISQEFGFAIALDALASTLVIGNPQAAGVVCVYERTENIFGLLHVLSPDNNVDTYFGHSVALTANALTVVVGAPDLTSDGPGHVHLFFFGDSASRPLLGTTSFAGQSAGDQMGYHVVIGGDLVVRIATIGFPDKYIDPLLLTLNVTSVDFDSAYTASAITVFDHQRAIESIGVDSTDGTKFVAGYTGAVEMTKVGDVTTCLFD